MVYELKASGPITAAEARRQRKKLVASMAADLRKKDRKILKDLRAAIKEKRAEKKTRIAEVRALCKRARDEARERAAARAAALREAAAQAKAAKIAEREAAQQVCGTKGAVRAEATAEVQAAVEQLERERARVKEEHASSYHKPPTRTRAEAARERAEAKAQSDDEVRNDIPQELVAVWEKVKHDPAMRATPRATRTEVFLQWVHDNSADVMHLIDQALHEDLARLEHEEREHNKAISKSNRYTRSVAHLSTDLDVDAQEYAEGWKLAEKEMQRDHWSEQTAHHYLSGIGEASSDFGRGFDDAVRKRAGIEKKTASKIAAGEIAAAEEPKPSKRAPLSAIFTEDDDALEERLANPDVSEKERQLVEREIARRARRAGAPPDLDEDEEVLRRSSRAARPRELSGDEVHELALEEMRSKRHGERALEAARVLAYAVHDGLTAGPSRTVLETRFMSAMRDYQKRHPEEEAPF